MAAASVIEEVKRREAEAWDQRYKHGKAAREWERIAEDESERQEICAILAHLMAGYELADVQAEMAFRQLRAKLEGGTKDVSG